MEKIAKNLIKGVKDFFKKNGMSKSVVGLSGGIDSAVTASLTVKALGNKNVHALLMPEVGVSSPDSLQLAKKVARKLKIDYTTCPINNYLKPYKFLRWDEIKIAMVNTKARIRANLLYNYANTHNALVLGTSNKSELMLGYFTKYGDGACDVEVIGDLWKTEVVRLAAFLKLPQQVIDKVPSAELYEGHTDEAELGAPYSELDAVLKLIQAGKTEKDIIKQGIDKKLVEKIVKRVERNKHKLCMPEVIKK